MPGRKDKVNKLTLGGDKNKTKLGEVGRWKLKKKRQNKTHFVTAMLYRQLLLDGSGHRTER